MGFWRQRLRRHPTRLLVDRFAAAILVCALLLTLPFASAGARIGLLEALFTATSAVCVTGLTVRDTGRAFSTFGHVVILALIQLDGSGSLRSRLPCAWFSASGRAYRHTIWSRAASERGKG